MVGMVRWVVGAVAATLVGAAVLALLGVLSSYVQDPATRDVFLLISVPAVVICGTLLTIVWWRWPQRATPPIEGTMAAMAEMVVKHGGMLRMEVNGADKGAQTVKIVDAEAQLVGEATIQGSGQVVGPTPTIQGSGQVVGPIPTLGSPAAVVQPTIQQEHVEAKAEAASGSGGAHDASVLTEDAQTAVRQQMMRAVDQLLPEGDFLLDRIRLGQEKYRGQADAWLEDVQKFFERYDYRALNEFGKSGHLLPFANTEEHPPWVHPLASKIDNRLVLLRETANRRYGRVRFGL
jgi:hypothetical protein